MPPSQSVTPHRAPSPLALPLARCSSSASRASASSDWPSELHAPSTPSPTFTPASSMALRGRSGPHAKVKRVSSQLGQRGTKERQDTLHKRGRVATTERARATSSIEHLSCGP